MVPSFCFVFSSGFLLQICHLANKVCGCPYKRFCTDMAILACLTGAIDPNGQESGKRHDRSAEKL
ncbi:hypothetical protein NC651_001307 [Populus alba x Populus x berolinensis]|nr:hypothetical protein NC651_001305 [Populus alba x Populus x berolinensis]KAJ6946541.1 hypothetical protein NC651_001307 [Populus alba x Populus x berolinensis]